MSTSSRIPATTFRTLATTFRMLTTSFRSSATPFRLLGNLPHNPQCYASNFASNE
jgi:hypothetical protein